MKNYYKLMILILSLLILGCNDNLVQSFGYQAVDDYDDPYVVITDVSNEYENDPDYMIEYIATDLCGIDKVELYVNGEYIQEENHVTGILEWHMDGYHNDVSLQLKAFDNLGKTSMSNIYMVEVNHLEFQIIDINEYNYNRDLKIMHDDSVWLGTTDHLCRYTGGGFEEIDVPGEGTINDFLLASNGDLYVSRSSYDLYRLRDNEWQSFTNPYGEFYYLTETADGGIYSKIWGYYHQRIAQVVEDSLEYVYIAPWASDFYKIGANDDGKLCYSDEDGIRVFEDGEWVMQYPGEDMRRFVFGNNGELYHYVSEYADSFYLNGTEYSIGAYEIGDIAYDRQRGMWLSNGEVLFNNGEITYILEEYFTNLPDEDFKQIEVQSDGDIYIVTKSYLLILNNGI